MSADDWYQGEQSTIEACCRQLIDRKVVEPLSTDEGDTRDWNLWELASLIEGHFHVRLDFSQLSDMERLAYERRCTYNGEPLVSPHAGYRQPFWLLDNGRRVGTIAITKRIWGGDLISIESLYVDPAARRRKVARRALEGVYHASIENGASGVRLDASWTWQASIRFYTRIGMWVWMWKHNLVFTWQPELPPYRVEIGDSEARFLIQQEDRWHTAVSAWKLGDRLGWKQDDLENQPIEMFHCVPGTFALHLALEGWPLIRSDETWEHRYHWSDVGEPEGLAYKIEIFEAVAREDGFDVRAPRIPGLQYRDLTDA